MGNQWRRWEYILNLCIPSYRKDARQFLFAKPEPGRIIVSSAAKRAPASLLVIVTLTMLACSSTGDEAGAPLVEGDPIGVQGAHEHGVASLGLAVDGSVVTLDLEVPGDALFGFEHRPRTDEERATVQAALDRLRADGGDLVAFDASLQCSFGSVEILEAPSSESEDHAGEDHHAEGADHDPADHHPDGQHDPTHHPEGMPDHDHEEGGDHDEAEHSEVHASITWTCAASPEGFPARLAVSELLPAAELVDLTVITSKGQAGARVGPSAPFRM